MNEAEPKGRPGGSAPGAAPSSGTYPRRPSAPRPQAEGAAPESGATDIQAYIGTRLREVYNDVASQPIPDRFLELMRKLDQTEKG